MGLMDLPPELFSLVIREYVSEVGVAEAWKHRDVCKTFQSYVTQEVFGNQSVEAFILPGLHQRKRGKRGGSRLAPSSKKLLRQGIHLYLEYQSITLVGASSALPGVVRDITQLFLSKMSGLSPEEQGELRREVIQAIIGQKGINEWAMVTRPNNISDDLYTYDSLQQYALCVAIKLARPSLVKRVFADGASIWKKTHGFGLPIDVATTTSKEEMVELVLRLSKTDTITLVPEQIKLMADKLRKEYGNVDDPYPSLKCFPQELVQLSLESREFGKTLMNFQLSRLTSKKPTWRSRISYFEVCIKLHDLSLLKHVVEHWGMTETLKKKHYPVAYLQSTAFPRATIFSYLLEQGILNVNEQYWLGGNVLTHAIHHDSLEVARIALEKGASPNTVDKVVHVRGFPYPDGLPPPPYSNIIDIIAEASLRSWPIRMAIKNKNLEMVKLLLEHGADPEGGDYGTSYSVKCTLQLVEKDTPMWRVLLAAVTEKIDRLGAEYRAPAGHEAYYLVDMADHLPYLAMRLGSMARCTIM